MAYFYCVGFPDLANCFARHGHVQNHPIYLNRLEAEKANGGKVTMVHEFYVKDSLLNATIERLTKQHENMLQELK